MANKSESCAIIARMAVARCNVSFTDSDGVSHTAHVHAESLHEAVALATAEFRDDHMVPKPGPTTEFTVSNDVLLIGDLSCQNHSKVA